MNENNNNIVNLTGVISSELTFNHEVYGEKLYLSYLSVSRSSDAVDVIPILLSDRLLDISVIVPGIYVTIIGQFRSYNNHDNGKMMLYVFVRDMQIAEEENKKENNHIALIGYICKQPIYRKTPLGREIADVMLAINRPYGKSDYIPCIVWGRNARYAGGLSVGTHCSFAGRIQSRQYVKQLDEEHSEERTAYEVSVSKLEVHEDEE